MRDIQFRANVQSLLKQDFSGRAQMRSLEDETTLGKAQAKNYTELSSIAYCLVLREGLQNGSCFT